MQVNWSHFYSTIDLHHNKYLWNVFHAKQSPTSLSNTYSKSYWALNTCHMRLTPYIKPESTGLHLTGSVSVDHWQCMARAAGFCLRTFTHARTHALKRECERKSPVVAKKWSCKSLFIGVFSFGPVTPHGDDGGAL